ncbi:MAG: hypothetical protein AAFX62_08725 [Pseudomonadota bacterium]
MPTESGVGKGLAGAYCGVRPPPGPFFPDAVTTRIIRFPGLAGRRLGGAAAGVGSSATGFAGVGSEDGSESPFT